MKKMKFSRSKDLKWIYYSFKNFLLHDATIKTILLKNDEILTFDINSAIILWYGPHKAYVHTCLHSPTGWLPGWRRFQWCLPPVYAILITFIYWVHVPKQLLKIHLSIILKNVTQHERTNKWMFSSQLIDWLLALMLAVVSRLVGDICCGLWMVGLKAI